MYLCYLHLYEWIRSARYVYFPATSQITLCKKVQRESGVPAQITCRKGNRHITANEKSKGGGNNACLTKTLIGDMINIHGALEQGVFRVVYRKIVWPSPVRVGPVLTLIGKIPVAAVHQICQQCQETGIVQRFLEMFAMEDLMMRQCGYG